MNTKPAFPLQIIIASILNQDLMQFEFGVIIFYWAHHCDVGYRKLSEFFDHHPEEWTPRVLEDISEETRRWAGRNSEIQDHNHLPYRWKRKLIGEMIALTSFGWNWDEADGSAIKTSRQIFFFFYGQQNFRRRSSHKRNTCDEGCFSLVK